MFSLASLGIQGYLSAFCSAIRDCCFLPKKTHKARLLFKTLKQACILLSRVAVFYEAQCHYQTVVGALLWFWNSHTTSLFAFKAGDPCTPTTGSQTIHIHIYVHVFHLNYTGTKMAVMSMMRGQLDKGRYHAGANKTSLPSCTPCTGSSIQWNRYTDNKDGMCVCVCVCVFIGSCSFWLGLWVFLCVGQEATRRFWTEKHHYLT